MEKEDKVNKLSTNENNSRKKKENGIYKSFLGLQTRESNAYENKDKRIEGTEKQNCCIHSNNCKRILIKVQLLTITR